jgi:L-cysteine desulfidase
VAAVTSSICGIAYQRGNTEHQINDLINLCICSFAGAICDGAKLSCAWKIGASYLSAFGALRIVEKNGKLPHNEGIVSKDAFRTINDLGMISQTVRDVTNSVIVDVVSKTIRNR